MISARSQLGCVLWLLLAPCEHAFSSSPALVTEHDWTIYAGDYAFGLTQLAPVVAPLGPGMTEQVIMPRTTWVYFGPWSTTVEGHDAPTITGVSIILMALAAVSFSLVVRHRCIGAGLWRVS